MISATCSPASRSARSRSSAAVGRGLAHHPVVGLKTALKIADERLHGRRVLIDDEEDRLGAWLGHGRTSRRRRTRRPSPDCTMRWQNSCPISLRRRLLRPTTGPATPCQPHECEPAQHGQRPPPAAARVHSAASSRHHHHRAAPRAPHRSHQPPTGSSATRPRPGAEALHELCAQACGRASAHLLPVLTTTAASGWLA